MKKFFAFLAVLGLALVALLVWKQRSDEPLGAMKEKLVSVPEDLKTAVSS